MIYESIMDSLFLFAFASLLNLWKWKMWVNEELVQWYENYMWQGRSILRHQHDNYANNAKKVSGDIF